MFENVEAMYATLTETVPQALLEVIGALLIQVAVLTPSADQSEKSLTFVGGTPVMAADIRWPVRALDADGKDLPYSFIAQIDLSELKEADLPDTGRLLFFFDLSWDEDEPTGKVIWDQSPTGELVEFPRKEALVQAEADWNAEMRAYVPEVIVFDKDVREQMIEGGLTESEIDELENAAFDLPAHVDENVFFGPKRMMEIETRYQTPTEFNLEWEAFAQSVVEAYGNSLTAEGLSEIYTDAEIAYDSIPAFQVLGLPHPEQDDPRYYLDPVQKPDELRLLFEFSVADFLQESSEGTVYFLIPDSDLKARNFDRVVTVYQQT